MRARHTAHTLAAFPIYSSAFLSPNELVLGGGGGTSKSGIKNKLRLYNVGLDRSLELIDEYELEKGEDAPMSMAGNAESKQVICGINSSAEQQEKGQNENCRAYALRDGKLSLVGKEATINSGNEDDYQKVAVVSPDNLYVAVAGMHDFALLALPSLSPAAEAITIERGEIYDATFSSSTVLVVTSANLLVYSLPKVSKSGKSSNDKGKEKAINAESLQLLHTIDLPEVPGYPGGSTFRAARFHPQNEKILYTVTNTVPSRSRTKKSTPRQAFVTKWNTENWVAGKALQVGSKGLTCFDISPNGKFLGFGSSDYSIGLLDSNTLHPLVTILKAHEFPPTTLRFNPSSTLLVSGSADSSVRVVSVPDSVGGQAWPMYTLLIFLTLFILLLAIGAQILLGARGLI